MPTSRQQSKFCALCDAAKRPSNHFLSEWMFLPDADKRFLQGKRGMKTRLVEVEEGEDDDPTYGAYCIDSSPAPARRSTSISAVPDKPTQIRRVDVMKSPVLYAKFGEHSVPLTLDSGAEADLMKRSCAERIGAKIYPTNATASQADGLSDLNIVGEVHCQFNCGSHSFKFNCLISESLSGRHMWSPIPIHQ